MPNVASRAYGRFRGAAMTMLYTIPDDELTFRAVRAGGPGGQHVNKTATKVEILWDVRRSKSLSDDQRQRVVTKLSRRMDTDGFLRVVAGERRSQLRNREAAVKRINDLVREALRRPKPRRKTTPPKRSREERLAAKKKRSELKHTRKRVDDDE